MLLVLVARERRPRAHERSNRLEAPLRQTIGGNVGRNGLLTRQLEHAEHRIVDLVGLSERTLARPPRELTVYVDHATGVRDVVWCVQNPLRLQLLAMTLFEKLVVRAT